MGQCFLVSSIFSMASSLSFIIMYICLLLIYLCFYLFYLFLYLFTVFSSYLLICFHSDDCSSCLYSSEFLSAGEKERRKEQERDRERERDQRKREREIVIGCVQIEIDNFSYPNQPSTLHHVNV